MAMYRHGGAKKRARILTRAEFRHALKVAGATREPERNPLILCLSHALGLRVTELARITDDDVLMPSGAARGEISLRAEIAKGCRPRTVPMSSRTLLRCLDAYLVYRVREGIGTALDRAEYRGLPPHQPLIYSNRGTGFSLVRKRRRMESGEFEDYWACDSLESWFRDFYLRAGLAGATFHSGRRSFATRLLDAGVDVEDVSRLLGHGDRLFAPVLGGQQKCSSTGVRGRAMMVRIEYHKRAMTDQSQQDYLRAAKETLGVEWDAFAELAGIKPRAFKTYRMPNGSKDHRALPPLARDAIDRLLAAHQKKMRRASNSA